MPVGAPPSRHRSARSTGARVRDLHDRAVRETNLSRPARAITLLRAALDLIADDPDGLSVRARLFLTLALNEAETRGVSAGQETLGIARRLSDESSDDELAFLVRSQQGLMAMRAGDLTLALRHLDSAAVLAHHATTFDRALLLINRGALNLYRGDLVLARTDLEQAVVTATAADLPLEVYKAKHNLGYLEFLAGNLPLAVRLLDEAARDAPFQFGAGLLDRARVLLEAGLVREADDCLRDAETIVRRQRQGQDIAEVTLAQAETALLGGEPARARRLAGQARDRFRRRGSELWLRRAQLLLIEADLAAGRPGTRLAPPALLLAAALTAAGNLTDAATAYRLAAQALVRSGRAEDAEEAAHLAGRRRPGERIAARLHSRLVRAELDLAVGQTTHAQRELRAGLDELAAYQARFGSIDVQTASAVHGRRLAELDVATALAGGQAGEVLLAAERGRAVTTRIVHVRPPADAGEAELLSALRVSLNSAREAHAEHDVETEAGHRHRAASLQQTLRDRSWTADGSGETEPVAGLDVILDRVRARQVALVVFVESAGRLVAVRLDEAGARLVDVGAMSAATALVRKVRADLDVLALDRLPPPLRVAATTSLTGSLAALDRQLLQPLDVTGRPLVVVPAGELRTLPWSALPARHGLPTAVAASATSWCRTTGAPAVVAPVVAALAGPDLGRAVEESAAVAAAWGTRATGLADRDAAVAAFAGADLVHLAAHGTHQVDSPLFSSIRLADGQLFAHELDPRTMRASHVVLSACEVGRATLRPGDEALGLTSVLLRLGVRSVVAGVARVDDGAAADVMARYHRDLAGGAGSAPALATALADFAAEHPEAPPVPLVCFGASWASAT